MTVEELLEARVGIGPRSPMQLLRNYHLVIHLQDLLPPNPALLLVTRPSIY